MRTSTQKLVFAYFFSQTGFLANHVQLLHGFLLLLKTSLSRSFSSELTKFSTVKTEIESFLLFLTIFFRKLLELRGLQKLFFLIHLNFEYFDFHTVETSTKTFNFEIFFRNNQKLISSAKAQNAAIEFLRYFFSHFWQILIFQNFKTVLCDIFNFVSI